MSYSRNHHHQLILHTVVDGILVTDGAARLDEGRDAGRMGYLYAVVKREKGIGCQHSPFQIEIELACFGDGLPYRVHPAGLPATLADQLPVFYKGNGVGL